MISRPFIMVCDTCKTEMTTIDTDTREEAVNVAMVRGWRIGVTAEVHTCPGCRVKEDDKNDGKHGNE